MVHNPLLSLSPDLIQLVKKQFEFALTDLSIARFNEIATVVIDLLWHPQEGFRDEGFVASAEVKLCSVSWSI